MILAMVMAGVAWAAAATTSYNELKIKAERFFEQREWASASAMYDLMLDREPKVAETYGHAIVAAGMRDDSQDQLRLMREATLAYVSFDSVFNEVERVSFSLGKTDLYEDFLLMVKAKDPWMTRTIDQRLMAYYSFRRNPERTVEYARIMLEGMPDDVGYLASLAQGQAGLGHWNDALATWKRILEIDPVNYDALLEIGNYNYMQWEQDPGCGECRAEALNAFDQAQQIQATPYVAQMMERLEGLKK